MSYQYGNEPDGTEWYNSHSFEEQVFIDQTMEQCPLCGEYVSKSNQMLANNGGICNICKRAEEKWEVIP